MIRNIHERYRKYRESSPRFGKFIQSKPVILLLSGFSWPRRMIRKLYVWVVGWAGSRRAEQALAGISFVESSVFPIPPDPLLIAMTTAHPEKFLRFASITTVASVLGGLFGYGMGVVLFETVGKWVIRAYGLQEQFTYIGFRYEQNAFLTVFTAAFTPIPFKLITIAAGVFSVNIVLFTIAAILGRGSRFFLVAYLMHHFGKRYKDTIEKYVDVLSLVFVAMLILGFFAIKYFM